MKPKVSNTGGISHLNTYKMEMTGNEGQPLPIRQFKPMTSYVLPREDERARYAAIPSRFS